MDGFFSIFKENNSKIFSVSSLQITIPSPKRTSIYYTGPRHPRSRASPAPPNANTTAILTALGKVEKQSTLNVPPNQASFNPAVTLVGFQGDSEEHCLSNVPSNSVNLPPQSILKGNLKQACYTPASTVNGLQGDHLVTSVLEVSKRTVEKPLKPLPKDAHLNRGIFKLLFSIYNIFIFIEIYSVVKQSLFF